MPPLNSLQYSIRIFRFNYYGYLQLYLNGIYLPIVSEESKKILRVLADADNQPLTRTRI